MKPSFLIFRAKEFSLLLIVMACTTVLLWSWEKTPFLDTLLPPEAPVVFLPDLSTGGHVVSLMSLEPQQYETKATNSHQGSPTSSSDNSNAPVQEEGDKIVSYTNSRERSPTNSSDNSKIHVQEEETEARDQQVQEVENNDTSESSTRLAKEKHNQEAGDHNGKGKREVDLESPVGFANASSSNNKKVTNNAPMVLEENQVNVACNYARGKWVVNNNRTLYSGFNCKQWLAPMWACRLMQRKDFSYEKLQWQPKDCVMEEFEGHKFLKRMQDKTLAFVGDSLGRQQFQSLMCMITGGKATRDVIDVGEEYGFITSKGSARPSGWAYRFPSTNTTILYHWSSCLCDLEPINSSNPQTDYAMHLDRPPAFLRFFLHKIDVLVLNTGHHWNRGKLKANRWVMYVGGKPNTDRKLAMIGDAKHFTIHSIVRWVDSQLPKHPHLKAFYRSISPRHFVNGDWNTGGSCDNTTPMSIGKEVLQDESSDHSAGSAVKGTGVKLLDITALSQLRDEGHISRFSLTASPGVQDCLHWCLPGIPDTWNEILFAMISDTKQEQES